MNVETREYPLLDFLCKLMDMSPCLHDQPIEGLKLRALSVAWHCIAERHSDAAKIMAEDDDQDFMGYAGRDGGKAIMQEMTLENQWKMISEPSEKERECERQLKEKAEKEGHKERKRDKKSGAGQRGGRGR